jgi:hypothetical protein
MRAARTWRGAGAGAGEPARHRPSPPSNAGRRGARYRQLGRGAARRGTGMGGWGGTGTPHSSGWPVVRRGWEALNALGWRRVGVGWSRPTNQNPSRRPPFAPPRHASARAAAAVGASFNGEANVRVAFAVGVAVPPWKWEHQQGGASLQRRTEFIAPSASGSDFKLGFRVQTPPRLWSVLAARKGLSLSSRAAPILSYPISQEFLDPSLV